MNNPSDFGGRITSNRYCSECTDSFGNLKSFGETIPHTTKSPAKRENLIFWIKLKYLQHLHRRRVKRILGKKTKKK